MSFERAVAPPDARSAHPPVARPIPHPLDDAQVEAIRPLLLQIVQFTSAMIADCRCSIQLFGQPDALRTVVASDIPAERLGHAFFPVGVGVAGWVARTGRPLLVPDVTREPRFVAFGRQNGGTLMCVPLADGAAFYGTLTAWAPKAGAFHRGSLAILRAAAHGAALAVAQALRATVQEAVARRATMLLALTRAVAACDDPRQAIDLVLPMVADAVPYRAAILVTTGEEETPDARIFTHGPQDVAFQEQLRQWAVGAYDRQRARGARGPRFAPMTDLVAGHMVFAAPLHAAGTLLGFICFFHTEPFDTEQQQTLHDCSYVIGTAVYNGLLFRRMLLGKERFEAAFAYTLDGLLLVDEAGTTALDANRAFYALTGIAPESVTLPLPLAALESRWEARGGIPAADAAGVRRWHIAPDEERELEVTETPIAVGDVPHRLRVLHDVTAARRIDRTRSEFMSVVSHELRSPLTAMYGFLNLLSQERAGPLTAMQRDCLGAAHLSVRQLWRLIDDINDLVQSDLGRLTLHAEMLDVTGVIRNVVESMMPLIEGARMRVRTEIAAPLPVVAADPVRFGQILNNLLANAIKFSEPETTILLTACAADDALRVSVRDTGPGVPHADAERIFERFVKGTNTPQQDASGLGLGLAVVRQLVALHGGRVWVESAPGGGSAFIFTLPLAPAA